MIEGLSRATAYSGNKTKYNKIDNNSERKISYPFVSRTRLVYLLDE